MSDPAAAPKPEWPAFVRYFVLPFLNNLALRPVLIAILGHVGLAWALALLALADAPRLENVAMLFLCVAVSGVPVFEELRIEGRPGVLTATVAASWAMGVVIAFVSRAGGVL